MDLRHRLRSVFGEAAEPEIRGTPTVLPGREMKNEFGAFWLRTEDYPLHTPHGRRKLEEMRSIDPDRLADLAGDLSLLAFEPDRAVFLDTETTSLSGGAGVFVFMAGIGFVHEGCFRVEQYYMRDYDEEPAMLFAFNERCAEATGMVSFFGKNFDRYRLEDRMAALGMASDLPVARHLDLYHVSRRLYQGRYANLKLKTLEVRLLGFHRQGDIPGAECPQAFFDYLAGADRGKMTEVFEHNLWDILSLAVLAAEVAAEPATASDRYTLACVHLRNRNPAKARPLLERACRDLPHGPEAFDAHLRLARIMKSEKEITAAMHHLEQALAVSPENPQALLDMAKLLEHQRREYAEALAFSEQARASLHRFDDGSARNTRLRLDAERRIERLQRQCRTL